MISVGVEFGDWVVINFNFDLFAKMNIYVPMFFRTINIDYKSDLFICSTIDNNQIIRFRS